MIRNLIETILIENRFRRTMARWYRFSVWFLYRKGCPAWLLYILLASASVFFGLLILFEIYVAWTYFFDLFDAFGDMVMYYSFDEDLELTVGMLIATISISLYAIIVYVCFLGFMLGITSILIGVMYGTSSLVITKGE